MPMNTKRILIIDDDAELCDEVSEMLRYEGYAVEKVTDSTEGQKLLGQNTYDVVILDYKMPGKTGFDLLKKIKQGKRETSIYLMTGKPFIEKMLKEEQLDGMVDGVIQKPFVDTVLLDKIK